MDTWIAVVLRPFTRSKAYFGGKKTVLLTQKNIVLIMRWLMVLLVIFMAAYSTKGINFGSPNYILALAFLILNLGISAVPERFYSKTWFVYLLFLLDIAFVSSVIYFSEGIDTDFYLIYFLSIFMSSVGQRIGGAFPVAVIASMLYGWLVYKKYGSGMFTEPSFWLRMPFFFLIAIFSSFWAVQVSAERKKKEEEERTNQKLKREIEMATEEILKSNENLKYYKEYNENIMASINSGVIVVDVDMCVTTFNRGASDIFHIVPSAVIGKHLNEYQRFTGIEGLLKRTMDTGKSVHRNEMAITTFSDKEVTIGISTSLLHSQTVRTNGAIAIFTDLTKTKSLEERVKHSEKLAILGEMAAVMAHEIRNPLNSIAGFSQLLQNRLEPPDKNRKYADIIVSEAFRVDTLISDILDFAHQKKTIWSAVNLETVIDKVIKAKKVKAEEKNIVITKRIPRPLPSIQGDAVRLERIILNLTNNSIEAIEGGGHIDISAEKAPSAENPGIMLNVTDDGCGIPPENIEAIFKPFFTTKQAGTGLGMAIIQKIIEEHQGQIKVRSEEGKGTAFSIFLPMNEQPAAVQGQ